MKKKYINFLTSWDVRHFFSWDYEYTCKVTYTVRSNDKIVSVRTVTYKGVDPMGYEKDDIEAHLVLDSRKEEIIMEPQKELNVDTEVINAWFDSVRG